MGEGWVRTWPGTDVPLGAVADGAGTNFALFSASAEAVELCLFDDAGAEQRVALQESTHHVWHGYLPGVGPGRRYGYRVHGPYDPSRGLRHNPAKLLLDPYARAIDGATALDDAVLGYAAGDPYGPTADGRDSAPHVPRSVVVAPAAPVDPGERPHVPWDETIVYELQVKGFTAAHPDVPEELRGSYAGLAHPAAVEHLRTLGVTAVELLPVHQFDSEQRLLRRGQVNYWGYNSLGFFAPHAGYSSAGGRGGQVGEFREMVRALHAAGLEVVLDVVYNHTAEADPAGPTLSFRGIDNRTYYRLADDPARYVDYTGCGNTLDLRNPAVVRLVLDSLRYWVTAFGVDGFRFDLAPALGRGDGGVDPRSAFFSAVYADPVLATVKLIAEPWDVGPDGFWVGRFPAPWSEWNGRFRDSVRDFWAGRAGGVRDLGYRLTGSSDLYGSDGRSPCASVNFVTCHDGFTLRDLTTYEKKRNDANGDSNTDGTDDNRAWNCGVEGETDDAGVNTLRRRQARNLIATLLLSTGVPMLLAGDELRRTQAGNNNAYCLDDPTTWLSWSLDEDARNLAAFVRRLAELRRASPVLRQSVFFEGRPTPAGDGRKDIAWFRADGAEMTEADWLSGAMGTLGMGLDGRGIRQRGPRGETIVDESYLLYVNAAATDTDVTLPAWAGSYELLVDTAAETPGEPRPASAQVRLTAHSLLLLRARSA